MHGSKKPFSALRGKRWQMTDVAGPINRRTALKVVASATGGMLLGFALPGPHRAAAEDGPVRFNAWIEIAPDDTVTLTIPYSEMGQGIHTATAMILADALDAAWQNVRVDQGPFDPQFRNPIFGLQLTGFSSTVRTGWEPLRAAGASARAVLIEAAAKTWGVDAVDCDTADGQVMDKTAGRSLSYGALAADAGQRPPQTVPAAAVKGGRLVGTSVADIYRAQKSAGRAVYGIDISLPGMLQAAVLHAPSFGGRLQIDDESAAHAVPGVRAVVPVPGGVAVVADRYWRAVRGIDALQIREQPGSAMSLDSEVVTASLADALTSPGTIALETGNTDGAFGAAGRIIEAEYELPYLAHAALEPQTCTAWIHDGLCEVWTGTQAQEQAAWAASQASSLPLKDIRIHTTLMGGAFGRRLEADIVTEAVTLAAAVGAPVKVIWSREQDLQHDFYRPASLHRLRAAMSSSGAILGIEHEIATQSIFARVAPAAVRGGIDRNAVEGAIDQPYGLASLRVALSLVDLPVPVGFWRSIGHSDNAFVLECFLDEIAYQTGRDPLELRLELLAAAPRPRRIVERLKERIGPPESGSRGEGRGIAFHAAFESFAAMAVDATVDEAGDVTARRVTCVIDCGRAINPDSVKAQIEGGIVFALSAALKESITVRAGAVEQSNFHDYDVLRMSEMPEVVVDIVEGSDRPGGVGELSVPPLGPALANAVFAATGRRIRALPLLGA